MNLHPTERHLQPTATALETGRMEVAVHLLGGQVMEGSSPSDVITRRGFPFVPVGGDGQVSWVPIANLKYVVFGNRYEPDPGDSDTERKALLSFRDGETIQAYLSMLPGAEAEGFLIRMRLPDTELVAHAVVCAQALLELRFVDRWGVGLNQWTSMPRRRRSDRSPELGPAKLGEGQSRIMQLASHYRDQLSLIKDTDLATGDQETFTRAIRVHLDRMLEEDGLQLTGSERNELLEAIVKTAVGYGPLDRLIHDPAISEIMVNGPNDIFIERDGVLMKSDASFDDEGQLLETIRRMIAITGRHIDELSPMVDARLPDGSRVNAIIRPASIHGPSLTIRKFRDFVMDVDDLLREGSLSPAMADFLRACVLGRMNVLVSGGTSSGKTTTLNVLSSYIPHNQRVITIEDAAELQIAHPHVISLEHRPPNVEGRGELTIRQLVRNSLRMRPDRILVGEVRGGEALDMLQAMNTGHDGSMSTIHSNSARDALSRLETMVMMASLDLPYEAVRAQIASAINLLVHQARMPDGRRKIVQIAEVLGYNANGPILQDIFVLGMGADLHLEFNATGYVPRLLDKAAFYGVQVPERLFDPEFARYIPAGSESMMPVTKDPLTIGEERRSDLVREVVVVPFSSNRAPLDLAVPGESARPPRGDSAASTSPELVADVAEMIAAARHALGRDEPLSLPSNGFSGTAAGVAPSTSEPVFVPRWQAPALRHKGQPTTADARRRVQSVVDSLVAYLGLPPRMATVMSRAFFGGDIKINTYATQAEISRTTASADLKRAASVGLLVAQRHPQLGVTYRAGAFLLRAVSDGLGLSFRDGEAMTPDSVLSKVLDSLRVTR